LVHCFILAKIFLAWLWTIYVHFPAAPRTIEQTGQNK
jgi:hypothetical protein